MIRALPYVWNALAVLVIALAVVAVVPRAWGQFTAPRATPDVIAIGYIGIGALTGVVLCAVSVMSVFWFRVPVWFRVFTALTIVSLTFGYLRVSALHGSSPSAWGSAVSEVELATFFGTLAAFTFPLVVTGHGYPGLIQRIWRRSRNS